MKDQLIIEKIKQGDETAFEFVFNKHYTMLCRLANQLLHDAALAEEIVDDAIFYLWEHRDELVITHSIRSYLTQAVRNRSLNEMKSAAWIHERNASAISPEDEAEFLDSVFIDDNHPLGELIQKELEEKINEYINQLPEECRTVFYMSRVEQMKQEDIAKELHISINTVKYHIKNALAYLRQNLSSYLASIILAILLKGL